MNNQRELIEQAAREPEFNTMPPPAIGCEPMQPWVRNQEAMVSIAISLKRIADALEAK